METVGSVNLSRLHVLTAVKKTLCHFSQEAIDQSFVGIVLENKGKDNLEIQENQSISC